MIARMAPNPTYSFLPIVMLKSLRSPPAEPPARVAKLLLPAKFELDHFRGVLRSRLETPFLDGVERGVAQQRAAADHLCVQHVSISRNRGFDLDLARDVHLLGKRRIVR